MNVAVVMGTRPEITKLEPVIAGLTRRNSTIIFSGQHRDYNMGMAFIDELNMRRPDYSLRVPRGSPALRAGRMTAGLAGILAEEKPDAVMVLGDTDTVLAASICSLKLGMPVCHVEAGVRSLDWRMPEEHNRIVADHVSELLFAHTRHALGNLESEGVHGRKFVTGNTAIDAVNRFSGASSRRPGVRTRFDDYVLLTLHRAENVDDEGTLASILRAVLRSGEDYVFPVHPRTRRRLREFGLLGTLEDSGNVQLINPVGYLDMLGLMRGCSFIVTDSGGVQLEATAPAIRKKVLIARRFTDGPESIEAGLAELAGTGTAGLLSAIRRTAGNPRPAGRRAPYGRGDAAERILRIMSRTY